MLPGVVLLSIGRGGLIGQLKSSPINDGLFAMLLLEPLVGFDEMFIAVEASSSAQR